MALKRFGDLKVGDRVRGSDGQIIRIAKAYEEHTPEKMYELETDEGKTIKASGNHLWYIETQLDYELYRSRRKEGKRFFGKLEDSNLELLIQTSMYHEEMETSLIDMVALAEAVGDQDKTNAVTRIAEAIGHIGEDQTALEDLSTGEIMDDVLVRTYDARLFSQQVLSLTGKKEYTKKWPLVIGRVVTTEDIVNFYSDAEIPVMLDRSVN